MPEQCKSETRIPYEDILGQSRFEVVHCEHIAGHGPEHSGKSASGEIHFWRYDPAPADPDPAVRCAESKIGKARYDLIPTGTLEPVARVMTFGAQKHAAESWRTVPDGDRVYYSAAMRHLERWRNGETIDPESGEHALAHAIADLLILLGRQQ